MSLLRSWRRQRHNRKLRRRIEALAPDIESHSHALARQQWGQLCDGLNGQMNSKKTWHLLRHLLDPGTSKSSAQKELQQLLHNYPGTDADLLDELADRYVGLAPPNTPPPPLPPYNGDPNPTLDADFAEAEIGTRYTDKSRRLGMFGGLEAMLTGLCDEYPLVLRRHREIFVGCVILFIYACALPTTTYHEEPPESCPHTDQKYCRNCEKDGHLATDASCPQRKPFAKHAKAAQGHQSRSAI
ncbi:hypothetical protein HPB49_002894 [Dermacentor silvarum]|uniref:Uncharacterized protein n=1 Tax=Dermacentor silvarum TaxID=543639 RepID=A0ACB8D2G4_DERSI|nr:hypothetical protein HPB49_002894 [Dermacentor silvarum]